MALLSGLWAAFLAVLLQRTDLPGARKFESWVTLPYVIPAYLLGMAWITLANPSAGLLKHLMPGGELPGRGIYGSLGIIFVEFTVAFAFPYLDLQSGFRKIDPSLEEAARVSGAKPWQVFRDIQLPLLLPSWIQGMSMAFLYACSSFGVPALLGLPARQFVLTTLIYSELRLGGEAGLARGFMLAGLLLTTVLTLQAAVQWTILRRSKIVTLTSGKAPRPSLIHLGRWKWPFFALLVFWIFLTTGLPWIALGVTSFSKNLSELSPASFTIDHFRLLFSLEDFHEGLGNSTTIGISVASLITWTAFLLGYLGSRQATAAFRISGPHAKRDCECLHPFCTPGVSIALFGFSSLTQCSLRFFFSKFLRLRLRLVLYFKFAAPGLEFYRFRAFNNKVRPCLEEAAESGATRPCRRSHTFGAALRSQLGSVFFLSALPVFTELTMSVLLTGPGGMTLGTLLFQLQDYSDPAAAAALAWLLLTAAAGIPLLLTLFKRSASRIALKTLGSSEVTP